MPVLGVVITHPDPEALRPALAAVPGVRLVGDPSGPRLPVALQVARREDDEPLLDALRALPGVLAVDLAFADFSDLAHTEPPLPAPVSP